MKIKAPPKRLKKKSYFCHLGGRISFYMQHKDTTNWHFGVWGWSTYKITPMEEIHNSCFELKNHNTFFCLSVTGKHECRNIISTINNSCLPVFVWRRVLFWFRSETIVWSFLHLMTLFCKVIINYLFLFLSLFQSSLLKFTFFWKAWRMFYFHCLQRNFLFSSNINMSIKFKSRCLMYCHCHIHLNMKYLHV